MTTDDPWEPEEYHKSWRDTVFPKDTYCVNVCPQCLSRYDPPWSITKIVKGKLIHGIWCEECDEWVPIDELEGI